MHPWDAQIEPYEDRVEDISERDRFRSAVDLIEWTITGFESPIESRSEREFVESTLSVCRSAVNSGETIADVPEDWIPRATRFLEMGTENGVNYLIRSLEFCLDIYSDEIEAEEFMKIFAYCYEAESSRSSASGIMVGEPQVATAREQAMLDHQKAILDSFLS
ncbi:hypothetical protein [Salininema proteolyticum]|uniref:Immunity protein 30 domain-containing protein n=1 Tax=Salininema proteolyticum TaxID=1607685 RepID=A0ABV8U2I0_9ACTN